MGNPLPRYRKLFDAARTNRAKGVSRVLVVIARKGHFVCLVFSCNTRCVIEQEICISIFDIPIHANMKKKTKKSCFWGRGRGNISNLDIYNMHISNINLHNCYS